MPLTSLSHFLCLLDPNKERPRLHVNGSTGWSSIFKLAGVFMKNLSWTVLKSISKYLLFVLRMFFGYFVWFYTLVCEDQFIFHANNKISSGLHCHVLISTVRRSSPHFTNWRQQITLNGLFISEGRTSSVMVPSYQCLFAKRAADTVIAVCQ